MNRPTVSERLLLCAVILAIPLVLSSLACDGLGGGPDKAPSEQETDVCEVPDVVGLDQASAQRRLVDLGIVPVRIDEPSESVAADTVISVDPPPGTRLSPCSGEVRLIVSEGPEQPSGGPTATVEATATGAPTEPVPTEDEWPAQDELPLFLTRFYEETYDVRFFGLRPEWRVDASEDTLDAYMTEDGLLVTDGYLAAFVGDEWWFNYRITLGGADYSNIDDFSLLARTQDDQSFVWVECQLVDGWLRCEGHTVVGGEVVDGSGFGQTEGLCASGQIQCDLSFEAAEDQYTLYVNGEERASFVDDTFSTGGVGFVVDGAWMLDYFAVDDPGSPAMAPFTLFRDDFDTAAWYTGSDDGEYALTSYSIDDGVYRWEVEAKDGVTVEQIRQIFAPFDPDRFPYRFDVSADVTVVSAPGGAAAGLLFRCQDYDNLYYARLDDSGQLDFYALEDAGWFHIAGPAFAADFAPGGANVLRVVADSERFSFWVNGAFLLEARDDRFTTGGIGLASELSNPGDFGVFEFDNLQIGVRP